MPSPTQMKVLVIGGTLFIGRSLVKELLRAGHEVTVLHRKAGHPLGPGVANIAADRNDAAAMREALAGKKFAVVFDNVYDWERGTEADQVEAAVRACGDSLTRYVFMSSVAVYGQGLDHLESDPLVPDDYPQAYARHKAMTERMLFRLHSQEGVPVVTFRPPFVYGPLNPFYREAFFWDRMRVKRPIIIPGDGSRLMHFAYVKDLVRACVAAMDHPGALGQAFNIGNRRSVTQIELVRLLARVAEKRPDLVPVPRERIEALGGNPMGDPLYFGFYFDLPPITEDVAKVERVLGIRPTGFETGLAETYRWYLRHHDRLKIDYSFEDQLLET